MDTKSNNSGTLIWWPDGQLREAPGDGFMYKGNADTYTWDGFLQSWVSGYRGNLTDFTPTGKPSKVVYALNNSEENKSSFQSQCTCGSEKVGSPRHSSWCDILEKTDL